MTTRSRSLTARLLGVAVAAAVCGGLLPAFAPAPLRLPAQAAPPGDARPGELVEERTRTSTTTRNEDGTLTTRVSAGAVHYRDGAGAWKRIDSTVVEGEEPGYRFRNGANSFRALFKDALDGEHLRFGADGQDFGLSLEGATKKAARTKGNGLTYPDAVGGVDLRYDVLSDGVKETLVLPDASSPTTYRFSLTPHGDDPVRAERSATGAWAFYSGTGLKPAFVLDAPVALDAPRDGQPSTPTGPNATLDVKRTGKTFSLVLQLDRDWLKDPARRFPVSLDPTITLGPAIEDASFPATCAGCAPFLDDKLYVGTDSTHAWRAALEFDLADLPVGADVTAAKLETYWQPLCLAVGTGFCNGTAHQVDLHPMATSWTTSSTSGQLGTSAAIASASVTGVNSQPTWVGWDVTATLRDWQSGAKPNFGVLLKRSTEPLGASGPVFYGRRHADPALQPRLVVTYPGDGVNLFAPDSLHSNGADLRWSPYPSTAVAPFTSYEVHRSSSASFVPSTSTRLTSISDRAVTTFRDTTAAAGRAFTYKVVTGAVTSTGRTVSLPASGLATRTLQPGADEGTATTVSLFPGIVNCAGYGADELLYVGPQSDATNRGLVRFDLRDLPPGATVTKAVASFWHPYSISTAQTVTASPATAEWHEGTADGTCTRDSATWYDTFGGVPWRSLGGDAEAPVATVLNAAGDLPAWDDFDVTATASRWVSGALPNHGLLLSQELETPGAGSLLHYHSDDFGVAPGLRPKLVVTYSDPGGRPSGPTVNVGAPLAGTTVGGTAVPLSAGASDDRRVDQVEFLVDGAVVGSDTTEPYSLLWNSTTVTSATHTVTTRARDDAGNSTTSSGSAVVVDNSAAPTTSLTGPTGSGSTYRDEVAADKPTGWWRLGESSGPTIADSSGGGRSGTLRGTPVLGARGALGRDPDSGMQVNAGSDDYVSVPESSRWRLAESFSLEWWGASLASQSSTYPGFLRSGLAHVTGDGWLVWWNTSTGQVVYKRDNREFASSPSKVGGQYRHYALAYDKVAQKLQWYVDGQPDTSFSGVTFQPVIGGHSLRLGRGDESSAARIDEPAVYSTSLSADRVLAHRNAGAATAAPVTGTVLVTAAANDDRAVTRVELLVDDVRVAEDLAAPYSFSWDTLGAAPTPDGVHLLTTKAYDAGGKVGTSLPVPVRVDNTAGSRYVATTGTSTVPELVTADPTSTSAVEVTVTNDSTSTWPGATTAVGYSWASSDAVPTVTDGKQVALGTDLPPGQTRKVRLDVAPPALPDGAESASFRLTTDLKDTSTGTSYAAKGNKPAQNDVQVAKALEDTLGLERWHHYRGTELGAGVQNLVDVANGNNLWRWTPSEAPGRGLNTVVDLTYNSLEKSSPSPVGPGVNLSISSLTRFGLPIDIHPNKADQIGGKANRFVAFTDGDGTTHRFDGRTAADGTVFWDAPPGVHLYLRSLSGDARGTWAFSRPDRVTYYYDADGYPTLVEDANGNRITYTVERIPPGEDGGPVKKRITRVTDAGGRAYVLDYYSKDEVKKAQVRGKLQRLTDHSGSAWDFSYYDDGNLRVITQKGGLKADGSALADRRVVFTYMTPNGDAPAIPLAADRVDPAEKTTQGTLVHSVRDPRGGESRFTYYGPGTAQLRGRLKTVTDRAGQTTTYTYDLTARTTTEAAPLGRNEVYTWDALGRATSIKNALGQTSTFLFDDDNKVTKLTEPTGAAVSYTYNANGYLTSTTDQNGHTTRLDMEDVAADANDVAGKWETGRTVPHFSQLEQKTNPKGVATTTVPDDFRWLFDYDARGNLIATTDPTGAKETLVINGDGTVASETDARGGVTKYDAYDANGLATSVTDQIQRRTQFGYDDDGQLVWQQDARHASFTGGNPRDYRTYYDYDAFHRMGRQSTPKSTEVARGLLVWSGADFDANDNTILDVDQHYGQQYAPASAFQVQHAYDAMDRETLTTALDKSVDTVAGERTTMTYDSAGRLTRQVRPLGVKTTTIANDHATDHTYDLLDRKVREAVHEVDATGVPKSIKYTHTCYDLAGDVVRTIAPRANRSSVSCTDDTVPFTTKTTYDKAHRQLTEVDPAGRVTATAYDANDNVVSKTDEGGFVERTEYDQRDKPVKTEQPFLGGTTPRVLTTRIEYDPNGNRSRVITPRAFDASPDKTTFTQYVTTYTYDPANQLTTTELPSAGTTDKHYKHSAYDLVGNLVTTTQDVAEATLAAVPQDKQETRTYYDPSDWVRTQDDHVNPPVHFDYDASGRQTSRTPQKRGTNELDLQQRQTQAYELDGMLRERADSDGQKVSYTYDLNNVTVGMKDASGAGSSKQKTMLIEIVPDGLSRPAKTRQKKDGETRWRATLTSYDLSDNVVQRIDDREEDDLGAQLKAGRQNDYTFDGTDRLVQQIDQGKDTQASTSDDKRITTTYLPQGWEFKRQTDKHVATATPVWQAKQTQDWTYYDNGQLRTMKTTTWNTGVTPATSTVTESHEVSYVDDKGQFVNGNQTRDVYKRTSPAAGTPCSSSTCTATYVYDARDRLTRHDTGGGGSTDYALDPAGNILKETQTASGVSSATDFTYRGTQLDTTKPAGGVASKSHYDDRGNLDCTTGLTGARADCNTGSGVQSNYDYDYLDRLKSTKVGSSSSSYDYDALDRTTEQEEKHGTTSRATRFSHMGLTEQVTKEEHSGAKDGPATRTKDYSYDAYGSPTGMSDSKDGKEYSYGKDPLGSVSQLIDDGGKAAAAYGYRPYGDTDTQMSAGDVSKTDPINPVRFTEKRYDSGSGTLDMGARRFGPSNRFLQEDRYSDALSDLDLATDPLTSNRYSLAGGNPANFVEVDGHFSIRKLWGSAKKSFKGKDFLKEVSGWNDIKRCAGGSLSSCGWAVAGFTPVGKAAKLAKAGKALASGGKGAGAARAADKANDSRKATNTTARAAGETKAHRKAGDGLTSPGPFAKRSVAATGPKTTKAQREKMQLFGREDGCHRCGTKDADIYFGDHQTPTALNPAGASQRLYPHCRVCSNLQSQKVKAILKAAREGGTP